MINKLFKPLVFYKPLDLIYKNKHFEHNRYRKGLYYDEYNLCKKLGLIKYSHEVGAKRHFYIFTELGEQVYNKLKDIT